MLIWSSIILGTVLVFLGYYAYKIRFARGEIKNSIPFLLRSIAFLILTTVLAQLEISRTATLIKKPLVRVFFDNSVSASYHRAVSAQSLLGGYQEIVSLLKDVADRSGSNASVELYAFGSEVRQIEDVDLSLALSESTTRMDNLLKKSESMPSDTFLESIVLVTDGQYTAGDDPRHLSADSAVPVHTIGIGELKPMVDVRVEKVDVPAVGIQGDMVKAEIGVFSIGTEGERIHVTLSTDKELLGTKVLTLEGDGALQAVRFQFELTRLGTVPYYIHATSVADEVNIANNRSSFSITTLKDRFTVALISGAPSANTGFLKRVMDRESKLLVSHYIQIQNRWQPSISAFWRTNYDLIILDNLPTSLSVRNGLTISRKRLREKRPPCCLSPDRMCRRKRPQCSLKFSVSRLRLVI